MSDIKTMSLHILKLDGGTQPRAAVSPEIVDDYAEAMQIGAQFPPVMVFYDGSDYWLADGFHRVRAYKKAGRDYIPVEVIQGTREDALWYSYGANKHGLGRTNEDKRRAVTQALAHPKAVTLSNVEIARHCGVSEFMVRNCKEGNSIFDKNEDKEKRTVNRGGKTYTQNTRNIGSKSKKRAESTSLSEATKEWQEQQAKAAEKKPEPPVTVDYPQLEPPRPEPPPLPAPSDSTLRSVRWMLKSVDTISDEFQGILDSSPSLSAAYEVIARRVEAEARF